MENDNPFHKPVIKDLDSVIRDEIFKNQTNEGELKQSYELKTFLFSLLKKNWLFVSVLVLGNIGIIYIYRKFLKK
jgi:hypothetical protein